MAQATVKAIYPTGANAELTPAQVAALTRVAQRNGFDLSVPITVHPAFGADCVMVQVGSMWLGIEKDGYTHS